MSKNKFPNGTDKGGAVIKLTSLLAALYFLTGCGLADGLSKQCKGELEVPCMFFLGTSGKKDRQIRDLEKENFNQQLEIDRINDLIEDMQTDISNQIALINLLSQDVEANETQIYIIQNTVNELQITLAEYETEQRVVGFVDPCGDGPGFDEVLLRMSDGSYIAYFQTGSGNNQKRFLSVLPVNVTLQTTDQQACVFRINSEGAVVEL